MAEDLEISSVGHAVIRFHVEFCCLVDVLEVADHEDHSKHAQTAGHHTLQEDLQQLGYC